MEDCPCDKAGRHEQHTRDRQSQVPASVAHWHSFDRVPAMPRARLHGPVSSTTSSYLCPASPTTFVVHLTADGSYRDRQQTSTCRQPASSRQLRSHHTLKGSDRSYQP